jgi:NAD(P)-dependent dehydrogenase (short-subunit alcohol dehydrogenase family)
MIKGRVENLDDEIYENLKSQNLMPVFHLVAAVREQMSKQTKTTGIFSKVVLVTSFVGKAGLSVGSLYAAFKGGIISLTKTLAKEFARFANVNGVACGPFADRRAQGPKNRIKAKYQGGSTELAKKDLTYEKVTPMISFLASDEAQAITGQIISVDGGLWLKLES